jgi:DNA-binding Xre family transcriptional regulator
MITPRIKEVCQKRGITTAYQLQKALPAAPSVAARLWAGEFERVDLTTLDRLCTLLRCKPNDLLAHERGG